MVYWGVFLSAIACRTWTKLRCTPDKTVTNPRAGPVSTLTSWLSNCSREGRVAKALTCSIVSRLPSSDPLINCIFSLFFFAKSFNILAGATASSAHATATCPTRLSGSKSSLICCKMIFSNRLGTMRKRPPTACNLSLVNFDHGELVKCNHDKWCSATQLVLRYWNNVLFLLSGKSHKYKLSMIKSQFFV